MFIEAKDDGGGGDNWSYKSCKAPVRSSPPTNQHPVSTGRMPFLLPNLQCQSNEGKISHSMDLLTPSSPGSLPTLSLTTNSSWLPSGRIAMPLISPLMPVPHLCMNTVPTRFNCLQFAVCLQFCYVTLYMSWSCLLIVHVMVMSVDCAMSEPRVLHK